MKDKRKNFHSMTFFHVDSLHEELDGLNIITMEEYLSREAITGRLTSSTTGKAIRPPNSEVDWNGKEVAPLWDYLRDVANVPVWDTSKCIVAFPSTADPENLKSMQAVMDSIGATHIHPADYKGKPNPVNAPFSDRLKEHLADRTELCLYNVEMQHSSLVHLKVEAKSHTRLLIHFYAFVMFEDWRQDLWAKRFIRDHVRYLDEIQCAAARIVQAVRARAKKNNPENNPDGIFDAFHIRRGDFQYKGTRISAELIYEKASQVLQPGTTLFIATDERDKKFFKILADHYDVCFLDDFSHLFEDLNSNYYGMLDQLISTKSRIFYGTWRSTFSGYINRIRGYFSTKYQLPGHEEGLINSSWYFVPEEYMKEMHIFWPPRKPFFMREFPTAWRNIDNGIKEPQPKA